MRYSRQFSNPLFSRLLYNALVQSKLEYSALVWNSNEDKYILMIEKVNKAFLRSLFKKEHYPHLYPIDRLLDMPGYKSLELWRNLSLLHFVFQLIRGSISWPTLYQSISCEVGNTSTYLYPPPALISTEWSQFQEPFGL
jgi:hypothetical protein